MKGGVEEDQTKLIQDKLHATAYSRQVIEDEVGPVEQEIASLPTKLFREIFTNQGVKPDCLSAEIEARLRPHLQRQVELKPWRREEFQRDHRAFIKARQPSSPPSCPPFS